MGNSHEVFIPKMQHIVPPQYVLRTPYNSPRIPVVQKNKTQHNKRVQQPRKRENKPQ